MTRVPARLPSFTLAVLVGLVLVHDAIYLRTYGDGRSVAFTRTGHAGPWESAVAGVVALGLAVALLAGLGLWRLAHQARTAPGVGRTPRDPRPAIRTLLRSWLILAATTGLLFMLQEHLERLRAHEALPGLGVFGSSDYRDGLAILLLVTFGLALTRALFGSARARLLARIAARRPRRPRPRARLRRPVDRRVTPTERVGRRLVGRAPPVPA